MIPFFEGHFNSSLFFPRNSWGIHSPERGLKFGSKNPRFWVGELKGFLVCEKGKISIELYLKVEDEMLKICAIGSKPPIISHMIGNSHQPNSRGLYNYPLIYPFVRTSFFCVEMTIPIIWEV